LTGVGAGFLKQRFYFIGTPNKEQLDYFAMSEKLKKGRKLTLMFHEI